MGENMKVNDIYKVKIIDVNNIGNGIAKIDNFVIFIKNALLDEEVEIKISEVKKNYAIAEIVKIIKKSDKRIDTSCKYYDLCGGCNFLHTTYQNERDIKLKYLEHLFNTKINYLNTNNELNYRNKVILHINKGILGLYNDKTHNICEIDSCLLLDPLINLKIADIKKYDLNNVSEIMIRSVNNKIMISITSKSDDIGLKDIECDSLYINNKHIKGEEYLIDEINGFKFTIYPDSFYQVNREGMTSIYNQAYDYLSKSKSLLDLYCGTGTIGIWNSSKFDTILGVEINENSIKNANINKKLNNISNIEFKCMDAKDIEGKFDTIIVDPPRIGLSKEVIDFLNESNSDEILYISCNPNTLKRDIDLLTNYSLKHISCSDMFPRTKHIESVCILERN